MSADIVASSQVRQPDANSEKQIEKSIEDVQKRTSSWYADELKEFEKKLDSLKNVKLENIEEIETKDKSAEKVEKSHETKKRDNMNKRDRKDKDKDDKNKNNSNCNCSR